MPTPESIAVREVEVRIDKPGGLRDRVARRGDHPDHADRYPADDIRDLFRKRWLVGTGYSSVQSNLGADILAARPRRWSARNWVALLAYNCDSRQTMLQATLRADLSPRDLSFTHALQTVASAWQLMPVLAPAGQACADRRRSGGGLCRPLVDVAPTASNREPSSAVRNRTTT